MPILVGIAAFLLTAVFILVLVGAIINFKDLDTRSYTSQYREALKGLYIFEIVSASLILLSCLYSFYSLATKKDEKRLYVSLCVPFALYTISSIIDTFWSFKIYNSVAYPRISMPGSNIAELVFLFIALIALVVGIWLQGSFKNDDKANYFTTAGMGSLFVYSIISLCNTNISLKGVLPTIIVIIYLMAIVISAVAFIISFTKDDDSPKPVYRLGNVVYPHPIEVESDDAAEQLRKLKKLFDDGVITAEEYEEKRKKYVDKL